MVKTLKKVFSSLVAMMTIVSSVGFGSLGFANAASAATLSTGNLIKASGPAVYYYAQDGKRYVFPNEKTYFSWYSNFSSVMTISDAELAAISIGGNVTVRPGTKLVKITTDPKVYAVTRCGTLHWLESETVAKALYGDAWASRVIDVPDAFFVNYTIGSSVPSAVHPDGQGVQYAGDTNQYVVWGGQKRKFATQAAYDVNTMRISDAVLTTISYPNGADVTGYESNIGDVVCAGAAVVTGQLSVALASDTPAGQTVTKNASSVPLAKYTFTGGASGATVTGLTVHRVGVGAAADLSNVYLYDQTGKRLTTGRTINSSSQMATFSSLNLTVPAGGTISVVVYGDFSSPSATGGQHAFEILDAASVVVTGSATISGSFPVRGNVFTVGTSSSGRLDVNKGTLPGNPVIGSADTEVSNFKLTANTNDLKINSITMYQAGSISNSDLTMLKLYQGSTVVATVDSVGSDGHIVLKFSTAYLITNGTTKVFSLHAKVGGRASRTIKTYVEYTTDVNATDTVYNTGAAVCIASTATGGCTAVSQGSFDGSGTNYIEVTTQGGTLTNAANGPATSNVAKGQLAVPLYNFALTSSDNTLEIRNIRFSIDKSAGTGCFVKGTGTAAALDGTNYFRSIKIKNMDTGVTVMGPTEFSSSLADASTGSGTITLSDSFNILAGQTLNLSIVADLSNTEDVAGEFYGNGTCGYKVTLAAFQSSDIRVVDTGEFLDLTKVVPNNAVIGNQLNVKTSSLVFSLAGSPSSGTIVKKQQNVPTAGLVLTAGAQSDITVTSITLTCQGALASNAAFGTAGALAACSQRITALSLWNGATQVGIAKAPDATTGAAQISNMNLLVPAGTSINLTVDASFGSTASTTSPFDKVSVGIAAAADVGAQDKDANTVTATGINTACATGSSAVSAQSCGATPSVVKTIMNSGTVTYNTDSNPSSNIVVAGKNVWVPFASYKATAQFEAIDLDRIAILASSTIGNTTLTDNAVFTAVAIASGGAVKGQDILSSGATGTKDIDLSLNKITVPAGGSVNFQIWAMMSNIQASSSVSGATTGVHRSGMTPAMGLKSSLQTGEWDGNYFLSANIRATGQASGERVYASSTNAAHGNTMVSRRTVPTVTKQSLSSTTLANIDQDLMKFQVAADSQGTIALKQVMFSISKTGALVLSNFRVRKGNTDMNTSDYAVTYASSTPGTAPISGQDIQAGNLSVSQNAGYVIVSFTNEESIAGSGNVYTLHASVSGAVSGQNVSLTFYRDPTTSIVTGYLISGAAFGGIATSTNIYNIDTAAGAKANATFGNVNATGTFLWSDNSETPHSSAVGASAGSRDWSNDVYVQDLSQSQTISL